MAVLQWPCLSDLIQWLLQCRQRLLRLSYLQQKENLWVFFSVAGNGFPGPGHLGLLTLGSQFDLELLLQ